MHSPVAPLSDTVCSRNVQLRGLAAAALSHEDQPQQQRWLPAAKGGSDRPQHDTGAALAGRAVTARAAVAAIPHEPPARRRRVRGRKPKNVPWDADTQAAVLAFWTAEGVLLPEWRTPQSQRAEQHRLRQRIVSRASRHDRHRNVDFLAGYITRMRAAAAALSWTGDPARLALCCRHYIADNRDPAGIIARLQGVATAFVECGIQLGDSKFVHEQTWSAEYVKARLPPLLGAPEALPYEMDATDLVRRQPSLLAAKDAGAAARRSSGRGRSG